MLYLDSDGVLANFDKRAEELFGMPPREFEDKHGTGRFWKIINSEEKFFEDLLPMPGAHELFDAVRHLRGLAVLTGVPSNIHSVPQKVRMLRKTFDWNLSVICCQAKYKSHYCLPGDILVDDREKYRDLWEQAGGVFVHHVSSEDTIEKLRRLGMTKGDSK